MEKYEIMSERRPCMVRMADGTERKALWHMFDTKAVYRGQIGYSHPVAVVEYEDGTVHQIGTNEMRFLDSKQEFSQYAWEKRK